MFSLACVLGEERGYCCRRNWQVRVGEGMCVQNVELITCVSVYTSNVQCKTKGFERVLF